MPRRRRLDVGTERVSRDSLAVCGPQFRIALGCTCFFDASWTMRSRRFRTRCGSRRRGAQCAAGSGVVSGCLRSWLRSDSVEVAIHWDGQQLEPTCRAPRTGRQARATEHRFRRSPGTQAIAASGSWPCSAPAVNRTEREPASTVNSAEASWSERARRFSSRIRSDAGRLSPVEAVPFSQAGRDSETDRGRVVAFRLCLWGWRGVALPSSTPVGGRPWGLGSRPARRASGILGRGPQGLSLSGLFAPLLHFLCQRCYGPHLGNQPSLEFH